MYERDSSAAPDRVDKIENVNISAPEVIVTENVKFSAADTAKSAENGQSDQHRYGSSYSAPEELDDASFLKAIRHANEADILAPEPAKPSYPTVRQIEWMAHDIGFGMTWELLFARVLRAIADGAENGQALARAALNGSGDE